MINFLKAPLARILSPDLNWTTEQIQWGDTLINFMDEGVIQFTPPNCSSEYALILSCGVHGNETAPIEIICELLEQIYSKKLVPALPLLIQFGNLAAIKVQKRFIDFNLNRLFSGYFNMHQNAHDSKRASILERTTGEFVQTIAQRKLWHLDLHTAIRGSFHERFAIRPFRQEIKESELNLVSDQEKLLLQVLGLQAMVQAHTENTTYSSFSCNKYDAISFTLELGKVKPFGENKKADFQRALAGLYLFIAKGIPPQEEATKEETKNHEMVIYKVTEELIKRDEQTILHLSDDYFNFMPLEEGSPIQTTNGITRNAHKGESVIFPNKNVLIGQRTGLVILPSDRP